MRLQALLKRKQHQLPFTLLDLDFIYFSYIIWIHCKVLTHLGQHPLINTIIFKH